MCLEIISDRVDGSFTNSPALHTGAVLIGPNGPGNTALLGEEYRNSTSI